VKVKREPTQHLPLVISMHHVAKVVLHVTDITIMCTLLAHHCETGK